MEHWLALLPEHGYAIVFAAVFLEAIGLPVPAALALLVAGGASARGSLQPAYALGAALSAMLVGDTLMFMVGRHTGWWLLGVLCRLSLNPESCILRSADAFYRRGRKLLLLAKFIPGINTMAPPLAGSMNMRFSQFLRLDLIGISLYIFSYFAVGFAFSGALEAITSGYRSFGRVAGWVIVALLSGYLLLQVWRWVKDRALRTVEFAVPAEAARAISSGGCIYDVRSHGYLDRNALRISGSRRLDPHSLHQGQEEFPAGQAVFVYCTCVREATSVRVARDLEAQGIRVAVIKGGLRAWRKAGLPTEPVPAAEVAVLPVFG